MNPDLAHLLPYLIPIALLALVLRRSLRHRKLNADRLWVMSAILPLLGVVILYQSPPKTMVGVIAIAAALALGAAAGWWRGRLTTITVDPETHALTSRTSSLGVLLIAGLFALRYGLRMVEVQNPGAIPGGAGLATDVLMVFGIGMMAVQRLEMWLRAERLLKEARAAKAAAS